MYFEKGNRDIEWSRVELNKSRKIHVCGILSQLLAAINNHKVCAETKTT